MRYLKSSGYFLQLTGARITSPINSCAHCYCAHIPRIFYVSEHYLVETEEIAGLLAEAAVAEIAVEPVCELKVRSVERQPQRGRQRDNAEIRFGELQRTLIVGDRS